MKKIAAVIATTLVTTSANAFITTMQGGLTGHSLREPFTYTTSPGISTSGNYYFSIDTQGSAFNSGTMTIDYNIKGDAGGYAYDITYTGVSYSLGSNSNETLDQNYLGQGLWLTRFGWGYTKNNQVSWGTNKSQTLLAGKPTAVIDTNGSYMGGLNGNNGYGGGEDGTMTLTGGSSSCVGNGCALWSANSFGLEGMNLWIVFNPNDGFALIDNWITMEEVVGTTQPFQISMTGSQSAYNPVPVPAAAWLMGSGLLALGGISRRKPHRK